MYAVKTLEKSGWVTHDKEDMQGGKFRSKGFQFQVFADDCYDSNVHFCFCWLVCIRVWITVASTLPSDSQKLRKYLLSNCIMLEDNQNTNTPKDITRNLKTQQLSDCYDLSPVSLAESSAPCIEVAAIIAGVATHGKQSPVPLALKLQLPFLRNMLLITDLQWN